MRTRARLRWGARGDNAVRPEFEPACIVVGTVPTSRAGTGEADGGLPQGVWRVAAMAIGGWPVQTFCSQGVPSNGVVVGAYAMGSLLWIKVSRSKNALEASPSRTLAAAGTARRLAAGSEDWVDSQQ